MAGSNQQFFSAQNEVEHIESSVRSWGCTHIVYSNCANLTEDTESPGDKEFKERCRRDHARVPVNE